MTLDELVRLLHGRIALRLDDVAHEARVVGVEDHLRLRDLEVECTARAPLHAELLRELVEHRQLLDPRPVLLAAAAEVAVQRGCDAGIVEARLALDHRRRVCDVDELGVVVVVEPHDHRAAIDERIERADARRQLVRQHRDHPIRQVHRDAAQRRFLVEASPTARMQTSATATQMRVPCGPGSMQSASSKSRAVSGSIVQNLRSRRSMRSARSRSVSCCEVATAWAIASCGNSIGMIAHARIFSISVRGSSGSPRMSNLPAIAARGVGIARDLDDHGISVLALRCVVDADTSVVRGDPWIVGLEVDRAADLAQDVGQARATTREHLADAAFGAAHAGPGVDDDAITVERGAAILRGHEHGLAVLGLHEAVPADGP
jgi:hypothetical protein